MSGLWGSQRGWRVRSHRIYWAVASGGLWERGLYPVIFCWNHPRSGQRENVLHNGACISFYPDYSAEVQRRRALFTNVKKTTTAPASNVRNAISCQTSCVGQGTSPLFWNCGGGLGMVRCQWTPFLAGRSCGGRGRLMGSAGPVQENPSLAPF